MDNLQNLQDAGAYISQKKAFMIRTISPRGTHMSQVISSFDCEGWQQGYLAPRNLKKEHNLMAYASVRLEARFRFLNLDNSINSMLHLAKLQVPPDDGKNNGDIRENTTKRKHDEPSPVPAPKSQRKATRHPAASKTINLAATSNCDDE
ncbi:hypothetical protein E3N88_26895 [Mikania micrantha]|uniref:Uncharacterized protein n=1 Tax=Mikania micrantha TaxID=192012 RepID=A0A5N6MWP2_9ASTR|nr:hypothetical protein E3N88_26895 [Mikania micrantha]